MQAERPLRRPLHRETVLQKASALLARAAERLAQGQTRASAQLRGTNPRSRFAARRASGSPTWRRRGATRVSGLGNDRSFLRRAADLRHRLGGFAADRRSAPLLAVGLLVVASLLAQAPGVVAGRVPATGNTYGPSLVPLNIDALPSGDPATPVPTLGPAAIDGQNAAYGAPPPALTSNSYGIDGSLLKPLAIDTSVPDISPQVRTYIVQSGDTLSGVADKFHLSMMTIWWANQLTSKDELHVGQKLYIPPVDGVLYKVHEGDTVLSIARQFHADPEAIISFNNLTGDTVVIGQELMVPDGRGQSLPTPTPEPASGNGGGGGGGGGSSGGGSVGGPCTSCTYSGSMLWPVPGGYLSQRYWWGHPAVDIAADYGTPVLAAARGEVIFAGWRDNGGGYQVWISHGNNLYTTYNHMSAVAVGVGQQVGRGTMVGRVGATGAATGPHCHFEVWIGSVWAGGYRVNPLSYIG
jgi:murein DD-endopeptidase MepM/ murein hydrolase activator NlpD